MITAPASNTAVQKTLCQRSESKQAEKQSHPTMCALHQLSWVASGCMMTHHTPQLI
jgi:hypothetical protein